MLALVFTFLAACGAGGQDRQDIATLTGTYTVPLPGGAATLLLDVGPSGIASGWMRAVDGTLYRAAGQTAIDEDGEPTVGGRLDGAMNAEFVLYPEDEPGAFGLIVTPRGADGAPQMSESMVFAVTRASAEAAVLDPDIAAPGTHVAGAAPTLGPPTGLDGSGAPGIDGRLVGEWTTQVVMNSPAGSVATEMLVELTADGVMIERGSRALGSVGGGLFDTGDGGTGEWAAWRTEGDVLLVGYARSPWTPLARYRFSDGRLVLRFVQDGSIQIWSRR